MLPTLVFHTGEICTTFILTLLDQCISVVTDCTDTLSLMRATIPLQPNPLACSLEYLYAADLMLMHESLH